MSSLPQPREEKELPAPPALAMIKGGAETPELAEAQETRHGVKQIVVAPKHEAKAESSDSVAQAKRSFEKANNPKEIVSLAQSMIGTLLDYNQNKRIVAIEGDSESEEVFGAFNEALKRFEEPEQSQKAPQAKAPQTRKPSRETKPTFVTAKPESREKANEKVAQIKHAFAQAKNLEQIFKIASPLVGTFLKREQGRIAAIPQNKLSEEVFAAFNEALLRIRKTPVQKKENRPKTEKPHATEPKPIKGKDKDRGVGPTSDVATGTGPNSETEKHNRAVRELSEAIKANPRLRIINQVLTAFAQGQPEKIADGLPLGELERIIRKSLNIQNHPSTKTPNSLGRLVELSITPDNLMPIANSLIDQVSNAASKALRNQPK